MDEINVAVLRGRPLTDMTSTGSINVMLPANTVWILLGTRKKPREKSIATLKSSPQKLTFKSREFIETDSENSEAEPDISSRNSVKHNSPSHDTAESRRSPSQTQKSPTRSEVTGKSASIDRKWSDEPRSGKTRVLLSSDSDSGDNSSQVDRQSPIANGETSEPRKAVHSAAEADEGRCPPTGSTSSLTQVTPTSAGK